MQTFRAADGRRVKKRRDDAEFRSQVRLFWAGISLEVIFGVVLTIASGVLAA